MHAERREHGRNEQDFNNESQAYAGCESLGEEFTTERGVGEWRGWRVRHKQDQDW